MDDDDRVRAAGDQLDAELREFSAVRDPLDEADRILRVEAILAEVGFPEPL
jgi:hypothetical protein